MSQANLLRLLALYPDVPASEWAGFFGWQWEAPTLIEKDGPDRPTVSIKPPENDTDALKQSPAQKPVEAHIWYLSEFTQVAPVTPLVATSSLAPSKTKPREKVVVDYFESTAEWRARLDGSMASVIECDEPDIDRCVLQLAQCLPFTEFPGAKDKSYSLSTLVVVDQSPVFRPLYIWQLQVLSQIEALVGEQSTVSKSLHAAPIDRQTCQMLLDQSQAFQRVVILTSFDQLWCDEEARNAWHSLTTQMREQGQEVIHLQPKLSTPNEQKVHWLMASAACLVYPSCHTLASLSKVLGGGLSELMAAWNHPKLVCPGHFFQIQRRYRFHFRSVYHQVPKRSRNRISEIIGRYRALKPDCQVAMESLISAASGREAFPDQEWMAILIDQVCGVDEKVRTAYFDGLSSEYTEIKQAFADHEALAPLFTMVDPVLLPKAQREKSSVYYCLAAQHAGLLLLDEPHPHAVFTSSSPLMDETGQQMAFGEHPGLHSRHLATQEERFSVSNLQKPNWANRLYRNSDGSLVAAHAEGPRFELLPASAERPQSTWLLVGGLLPWARQAGIDEHGLWAELDVDNAAYRLRWIPPGSFMMGSPENEQNRSNDEHLHEVTLGQGYWLGETTVTQALWQSITSSNPSEGKENGQLPVNAISWDDCRYFIAALQKQLPSFHACLPTEAQWEHACRAGTQTRFWWGDEPSEEKGNMNNSKGAVIETHYPANGFGLKSMHGNLFEWCQDWYDKYPQKAVMDPQGPETGQYRVLRGGCWIFVPPGKIP